MFVVMGDMNQIHGLAANQHGVFSRSQAQNAGFERSAMHRFVRSGLWVRLDHSVFAVPSAPPIWERDLMAAVLSRPGAIVGHESAAHLLGMKDFSKERAVIIVPEGSNLRSELARVITSDQFTDLKVTRVGAFPVTTVPETLLTLAADLGPGRLEEVFDDALLKGKLDLDAMKAILDREAGRRPRGIKTLRDLTRTRLPTAPTQGATYLEAVLERLLGPADIPPWTREYPFSLGGKPARVDVYIAEWRLVIEADGRNWHLRRLDFENDRRRDNELASRGIQVLRYTYRMLTSEPERCLAEILAVGAIRTARRYA